MLRFLSRLGDIFHRHPEPPPAPPLSTEQALREMEDVLVELEEMAKT